MCGGRVCFGRIQRGADFCENLLLQRRGQASEGGAVDHVAATVFEDAGAEVKVAEGSTVFGFAGALEKIFFQQRIAADAARGQRDFIGKE